DPRHSVHADDLGDERTGELHTQAAAWAGAVPHAEHETVRRVPKEWRRVTVGQLYEFLTDLRIPELRRFLPFDWSAAVTHDRIDDTMRRLQAGHLRHTGVVNCREVGSHDGQLDQTAIDRFLKC